MTDRERNELIAALEKAEGPSFRLDLELYWIAHMQGWRMPRYTSSIEDALTLVPEGRRLYLTILETGRAKATCEDVGHVFDAHPNAAIAICIAALKARGA